MSEWISVKDRMPPGYTDVLAVIYSADRRKKGIITVAYWEKRLELPEGLEWIPDCGWDPCGNEKITHWMPLPELPGRDYKRPTRRQKNEALEQD